MDCLDNKKAPLFKEGLLFFYGLTRSVYLSSGLFRLNTRAAIAPPPNELKT